MIGIPIGMLQSKKQFIYQYIPEYILFNFSIIIYNYRSLINKVIFITQIIINVLYQLYVITYYWLTNDDSALA